MNNLINRKRKIDEELLQSVWKVKVDDVEIQKSRAAFGSRVRVDALFNVLQDFSSLIFLVSD